MLNGCAPWQIYLADASFMCRTGTKGRLITSLSCLGIPIPATRGQAIAAVAGLVLACKHLGLVYATQDGPIDVAFAEGGVSTEFPLKHDISGRPQEGVPRVLLQQPAGGWIKGLTAEGSGLDAVRPNQQLHKRRLASDGQTCHPEEQGGGLTAEDRSFWSTL